MDKRWKVMHQYTGGEMYYSVYRKRRGDQPLHSGNIEHPPEPYFFECSADAEARADELNREAGYVTET